MGLSPEAFWSLTVREFWIKHAAFFRSEHRQRANLIELALRTTDYKKDAIGQLQKSVNALRRYPLKQWLLPDP